MNLEIKAFRSEKSSVKFQTGSCVREMCVCNNSNDGSWCLRWDHIERGHELSLEVNTHTKHQNRKSIELPLKRHLSENVARLISLVVFSHTGDGGGGLAETMSAITQIITLYNRDEQKSISEHLENEQVTKRKEMKSLKFTWIRKGWICNSYKYPIPTSVSISLFWFSVVWR